MDEILRSYWDLEPRKFSDFDHAMNATFTIPELSPLLRGPMMCRYFLREEFANLLNDIQSAKPNENERIFLNLSSDNNNDSDHFIFVWKKILVIGDANSRKFVKEFSSYIDMACDIRKYFPMIDPKEVDKACKCFSQCEVATSPYDHIL